MLVPVALPSGRPNVATRPAPTGVAHGHEDDRDRARGLLRGEGRRRVSGHDDVRLEPYQFGRELRKPLGLAIVVTPVDLDGLPFDVAEIAHAGQEVPGARIAGRAAQVADAGKARSPRHGRHEATAGDQRQAGQTESLYDMAAVHEHAALQPPV